MNEWSKQFNALPKKIRRIACAVGHEQRIRDLERDKERLKKNCAKQCADLDTLIKNMRRELDALAPTPPEQTP